MGELSIKGITVIVFAIDMIVSIIIKVTTDGPDPTLPTRLYWMKMVPPKYAAEDPDTFAKKPVGTGPYKFVEWARDDHVTLEANTEYWGGAPSIKTVVIRPIAEEVTRLAALQAGEVDLVRGLIPEYAEQVPNAVAIPGLEFPWLRLNALKGPTADPKVRLAINYAIDKDALAESLYLERVVALVHGFHGPTLLRWSWKRCTTQPRCSRRC